MATTGKPSRSILRLALLAGLAAVLASRFPPGPSVTGTERLDRGVIRPEGLADVPSEAQEFLRGVLEQIPEAGEGIVGYDFRSWPQDGKPTRTALGIKAVPGVEPRELIARVMDVDGYEGRIAHVAACRSIADPRFEPPGAVRFYQKVAVPGVARVQQELVLVDLGTIKGYRVACWYLLGPETEALDPADGARSAANVGAWMAGPGVVGYALSCWPRRGDVNAMQWFSLTTGADALARGVVEGTIDGMAAWSLGADGSAPAGP